MPRHARRKADPVSIDLQKIRSRKWSDPLSIARDLTYLLDDDLVAQAGRFPKDRVKRVPALGRLLDKMLASIAARERKSPPPYERSLAFAGAVLLRRTTETIDGVQLSEADVSWLYRAIEDRWQLTRGPNTGGRLSAGTFRSHNQEHVYDDLAYEFHSFISSLTASPEDSDAGVPPPSDDATMRSPRVADTGSSGIAYQARVHISTSPAAYRDRIVASEASATRIDRLPKRISVIFKDEATVLEIATKRFGHGSRTIAHYVAEHRERRANFLSALSSGLVCREIYNTAELLPYVTSRRHSSDVYLDSNSMRQTVTRWREAILTHPSYLVGLTEDPLPFKYEIIDSHTIVLHEVIGVSDLSRLNAIFFSSTSVASQFQDDFELIWERIPPGRRDPRKVVDWIDNTLMVNLS